MAAFPVELFKGHDNSPEGFDKIAYIRLPLWLAKKLIPHFKKEDYLHTWFQVVEETEKAYKFLFCRDSSMSYEFCRPTWYVEWVSKAVVEIVRTDFEECEKEECEYYTKKFAKGA